MTTYTSSCHCGAVRFEVVTEIDHVRVCDCSVCVPRRAQPFDGWAVNVHFLRGIYLEALPIERVSGSRIRVAAT